MVPPLEVLHHSLSLCAYFSTHIYFLNTIKPSKLAANCDRSGLKSAHMIRFSGQNQTLLVTSAREHKEKLLSCWRAGLWSPSPQLTPPNPHSSPCRLPEEICLYPVNAVQRVHCVCVSLLFSSGGLIFFCASLHAFQPPDTSLHILFSRKCE